ncbi:dual specificity protein phosphatase 10 [Strongylocentrotus purpuratus]|uniref:protein-tyrosine-phosphatase n=1 Tax=Strongylocentrotus purpuratus TaxID=7668 RepID=A0A7M7RCM7_STRPU|nr:dual specificity protein phosphatase 10 [Strongylocentrotus purpuratus]
MSPNATPTTASTQKGAFSFPATKSEKTSLPDFCGSELDLSATPNPHRQCHINSVDSDQCNMAASSFTFALSGKSPLCASALKSSSGNGSRTPELNTNMRVANQCLLNRACEQLQQCSPRIFRKLGKSDCKQNQNNQDVTPMSCSPSSPSSTTSPLVLPQELSQRLDNRSSLLSQCTQSRLCRPRSGSVILVDIRPFLAFSRRHISGALNVNCATRFSCRRLREGKVALVDLVTSEEGKKEFQGRLDQDKEVVVYDEESQGIDNLPVNHPTSLVVSALKKEGVNVRLLKGGIKEFANHGEDLFVSELTNTSSTSSTVINDGEEPPSPTTDSEHILRGGSGICPSEGIPMTQILPHLYVGNEVDAANIDALRLHGISHVLNVTNSVPCFHEGESAMRYMRIPVRDNGLINLRMHFQAALEFIEEARRRNARVLVHCHAGISRSSTVVIAYVMKHMNQAMSQAYQFVKNKRPIIAPNLGFVGQLMEFEQILNKMNAPRSAGCRLTDSPTTCAKQLHHSRPGTPSLDLDTAVMEA